MISLIYLQHKAIDLTKTYKISDNIKYGILLVSYTYQERI